MTAYLKIDGHQSHVDVPEQSNYGKKLEAALERNEAEADNRSERPDLVPIGDDLKCLGLQIRPDLRQWLPLQDAHDDEEGGGVHDRTQCYTVNKPLCHHVRHVQPRLVSASSMRFLVITVACVRVLLDISLCQRYGHSGRLVVRRKGGLEKLLPFVVRRGRDEMQNEKSDPV
jgi:hypothetical protein